MKNLTRVLVLALVFSMLLSSVAFGATFTDVEDGTAIAEATDVLAGLGILKGYEDGSFGPDKVITRAEVVAVANRLQGLSTAAQAAAGSTIYTDVAADAWYAGDVNLATQMGIIAGDGNGLFRPEDSVKYEEAVKIMVAALGYQQNYVMAKGGWPTGYLVIASEAGVTKGLNGTAGQDAYRGIVARLAYNALNAPMMVQDGYNSDGTFQYQTKKDAQLSYDKLGIYKVDLSVIGNAVSGTTTTKTEDVRVAVKGHYEIFDTDFWTAQSNGYAAKTNVIVKAGETNIADFLGYTVTAFVEENDEGAWVVKAFTVPANMNSVAVIEDATKIMPTNAQKYPSTGTELSVYDDEIDTTNTTYELNGTLTVLVNGGIVDNATIDADIAGVIGAVELLDNDNDGDYDYVFVTKYTTDIVTEVYSQNKKIGTNNAVIDLTNAIEGKKGYSYTMTLDGEAITPADLQEDDVISWSTDANNKNYKILVSRETVTGALEETDTYAASALKYVYVIDGESYGIANIAGGATVAAAGLSSVQPGDEGIAYLDVFGKIAYFEKTSTSSDNYAFIVNMGSYDSVGEVTYEIQLFTKEGEIVTYDLAEKVRVNGVKSDDADDSYADIVAAIGTKPASTDANLGLYAGATTAKYAARLVTYKANTNNVLTAIDFATAYNASNNNEFDVINAGSVAYSAKTGSFDTFAVTDNTVIFNLPVAAGTTKEDLAIDPASILADEESYDIAYFSVDKDTDELGAIIITNNAASVGADQNLAIFLKAMKASNGEDDVYKVTFMQGGEECELTTTADWNAQNVNADDFVDANIFTKGALFAYSTNAAGDLNNYKLISGVAADTDAMYTTYYGNWVNLSLNRKDAYEFGFVNAKNNGALTLADLTITGNTATFNNLKKRAIDEDATFTIIDLNKSLSSDHRVVSGAFAEVQKLTLTDNNKVADEDRDVSVFIKYYDDEIVDVVIIKGAANKIFGIDVE